LSSRSFCIVIELLADNLFEASKGIEKIAS